MTLIDRLRTMPQAQRRTFINRCSTVLHGLREVQKDDPQITMADILQDGPVIADCPPDLDVETLLRGPGSRLRQESDLVAKVSSPPPPPPPPPAVQPPPVTPPAPQLPLPLSPASTLEYEEPEDASPLLTLLLKIAPKIGSMHYTEAATQALTLGLINQENGNSTINNELNCNTRYFIPLGRGLYMRRPKIRSEDRPAVSGKQWDGHRRPKNRETMVAMVMGTEILAPNDVYKALCKLGWGEGLENQDIGSSLRRNSDVFELVERGLYRVIFPEHFMKLPPVDASGRIIGLPPV